MAEQTSIFNLIIEAVYSRVIEKVIDEVSEGADSDLNMPFRSVLKGRYRNDPAITEAVANVKSGDESWSHTLNVGTAAKSGIEDMPYEMPHGVSNRRRFVVEFRISFNADTTEAEAYRKAHLALSRIENAIWTMESGIGPDTFGEISWFVEINDSYVIESGSDGKLWRGRLLLTFPTTMSVVEV